MPGGLPPVAPSAAAAVLLRELTGTPGTTEGFLIATLTGTAVRVGAEVEGSGPGEAAAAAGRPRPAPLAGAALAGAADPAAAA